MPANPAARIGDAIATGHGCDAVTTIAGPGAPTVLINNIPAARAGDLTVPHTIGTPPFCSTHTSPIISTGTVLINNNPAARVGDSVCAGTITSGSANVIIG